MLSTPPATPRRWLPRPRYSLRVLLVAFTAVAIGFPVWYRWPYEEKSWMLGLGGQRCIVTTWQRQWGGGRLQHGPERWYRSDGSLSLLRHYANGQRHGRCEDWEPGRLETSGYYRHDKKSGTWTEDLRAVTIVQTWKEHQLDGPCEFRWPDQPTERMTFAAGRLTHVNGRPTTSPLFDAYHHRETRDESKAIDDMLYSNLNSPTTVELANVPLSAFARQLGADNLQGLLPYGNSTPILLDPRLPDFHVPLTHHLHGLDVKTAVVLLLAKHGLVADYHYGAVWVTTPELAGPWPDPTGIDQINPPEGSQLANVWDQPVDVTTPWRSPDYPGEQPLAETLAAAFQPLAISIDASRIASTAEHSNRFPVVAYLQGIPFRHALAYLLFQTKCRGKLEGETLVILPPENEQ